MTPKLEPPESVDGIRASGTPLEPTFPYAAVEGDGPLPPRPGADVCPYCAKPAVNGQGVLDCPDCQWTGAPRTT